MNFKSLALSFGLGLALCASGWAQAPATKYSFENIKYPHDKFTQLLGINNAGKIAGYHNFNSNSGFTLVPPSDFTTENYPGSAMTQVIGINNNGRTDGFYVDSSNVTHGFFGGTSGYFTVDYPGTAFNQLLSQNDHGQASGYYSMSATNSTPDFPYVYDEYGGIFEVITIAAAVNGAQATGINDEQQVCGFYVDSGMVNHGWLLNLGKFTTLDFPDSTGTQALGLNNKGQVVGFYNDSAGATHGFVYQNGKFTSVDDPKGVGQTTVNGINDKGQLVGFFGSGDISTGFVATPE